MQGGKNFAWGKHYGILYVAGFPTNSRIYPLQVACASRRNSIISVYDSNVVYEPS